jgi:hypothetical protein
VLKAGTTISMYKINESGVESGGPLSWIRDSETGGKHFGPKTYTISQDTLILAFYSSCTAKPDLFQFYYFGDGKSYSDILSMVKTNDDRVITSTGFQYCAPYNNEGSLDKYTVELPEYNFYIPTNMEFAP